MLQQCCCSGSGPGLAPLLLVTQAYQLSSLVLSSVRQTSTDSRLLTLDHCMVLCRRWVVQALPGRAAARALSAAVLPCKRWLLPTCKCTHQNERPRWGGC